MSSTTPGSEPDRGDLDGDGLPDRPVESEAEPTPTESADAQVPAADPPADDDVAAEQAQVDPTAPEAEQVDRVEQPVAAPDPTNSSAEELDFVGRDDDAAATESSELDAAVERARTEHPPVVDDTTVIEEHPEPVRAEDVRRETGVPETVGAAGVVAAGAGATAAAPETPPPPLPQTIYVQAPTPPRAKGNRGFGILVGLLATVGFALLYAGISFIVITWYGAGRGNRIGVFTEFLAQPVFWIPVLFFFLAFALLAAVLNRAAWWTWAVFGLGVGILVYFSYIGGALLTVAAWQFTPEQAAQFVGERWVDPFAIIAFIVARELPIWFGGWIAARGRTVGERNARAREEYDRQIAAGPQPVTSTR
jgi:hypothetical protein